MARTGRERTQRRRMARRAARSKVKPKREAPTRRVGTFHIPRYRMTGGPPTKGFYLGAAIFALVVVVFPSLLIASTVWMDPYPLDPAARLSEAGVLFFQAMGGTLLGLVLICPLALAFGGWQILLDSPLVRLKTNVPTSSEETAHNETTFQETIEENI